MPDEVYSEQSEGQGMALELKTPEGLQRPQFANYVHSTVARIEGDVAQTTLTFVHIYPVPTSPEASEPHGEVVARVTLMEGTARALRDLLIRQNRLTPAELDALAPSARKGTRSKQR